MPEEQRNESITASVSQGWAEWAWNNRLVKPADYTHNSFASYDAAMLQYISNGLPVWVEQHSSGFGAERYDYYVRGKRVATLAQQIGTTTLQLLQDAPELSEEPLVAEFHTKDRWRKALETVDVLYRPQQH